MSDSSVTIYSIGHSSLPRVEFINLLKDQGIDILVDVRSTPYSKFYPQFNKDQLKAIIGDAGMQYQYLGKTLGGRPNDPDCYKSKIIPDEHSDYLYLVDYPEVMKKELFQKGIDNLLQLAKDGVVAIMCSEEDPNLCHRHHLIGKFLTNLGVVVIHIRRDGNLVKDQLLINLSSDPPVEQLKLPL